MSPSSEHRKIYTTPRELSAQWGVYSPEYLGATLLQALGAELVDRRWALPDGSVLPPGGPLDFGSNLGCIQGVEHLLGFDQHAFTVGSEYGGWTAEVAFSDLSCCRTPYYDSEEQARAILLLTVVQARQGFIEPDPPRVPPPLPPEILTPRVHEGQTPPAMQQRIYTAPCALSEELVTCTPEERGDKLLRAVRAQYHDGRWALIDGTLLRAGGRADFGSELAYVKDVECKLTFDIQGFHVEKEPAGWCGQVYFPAESTPDCRLYRTAGHTSELLARLTLLITYARAALGLIGPDPETVSG